MSALINPGSRYAPSHQYDIVPPKFAGQEDEVKTQIQNTSTSVISYDLIQAIVAGETQITRRVEIYESDGVTPWSGSGVDLNGDGIPDMPVAKIVSGSVGISAGGDSRRSLDLTLDNSDGSINHDPDGFWYDKIIKVFRGVEYQQQERDPTVFVVNQKISDAGRIGPFLNQLGISRIVYWTGGTIHGVADLVGYDIIIAYSPTTDFDAGTAALLLAAYNAGYAVLTFSACATTSTVPLIGASAAASGAYGVVPPTVDAPWVNAFKAYNTNVSVPANGRKITLPGAGASAASGVLGGVYASLYSQNTSGGQWFHYQIPLQTPFSSTFPGGTTHPAAFIEEKKFLRAAVNWLFDYQGLIQWETQVGEFMIDRITQPRFPHQLTITGRDYSKKLDLSKFLSPTTYASGTDLIDVLYGIAYDAGITNINVSIHDQTLTSDAPFDRASSRLDAINALASAYNFEWFFDKFGTLVIRGFRDPSTSEVTLSVFIGGNNGNLIDYSNQSDDTEMYNHIIVTGQNNDGTDVYKGESINDDPASPTCRARVGDRAYFYTSSFFTSSAQCQAYSDSLLKVKSLEAYELDFNMLVFPWIEVNEIMEFTQETDTYPTRFLFTDGSVPLDLSPMSGTGKRVAKVNA